MFFSHGSRAQNGLVTMKIISYLDKANLRTYIIYTNAPDVTSAQACPRG
jgi:hypothetical protein